MGQQLPRIPRKGDRGMYVEALQAKLLSLNFDTNGLDGIYGKGTTAAVSAYQKSVQLPVTGAVDEVTFRRLDFTLKTQVDSNPEIAIADIVDSSGITTTEWANRGPAVWGYYHGMALMFASLYTRLKQGDPIAKEIAKSLRSDPDRDALKKFDDVFATKGMSNAGSEADRLRHLFVLQFGLGVMESNGKYCAGIDTSQDNDDGESTETGLFQTSYDVRGAAREKLGEIFSKYRTTRPAGFLRYFSKGFKNYTTDNYGSGDAREFQELTKACPAFAVEFTAVALRNVSNHWAPIKHKEDPERSLEVRTACDELLQQVQAHVDDYGFYSPEVDLRVAEVVVPLTLAENHDLSPREAALARAIEIGQEEKLKELFDKAPESKANYWAIVDFNKPSSQKRLFIFDLKNGSYTSYLVAHAKNSGDLYAVDFSNEIGSEKSCVGIFKTAETYEGKNGRSLRLDGLESSNSNTRERAIVIHKGKYVVPDYEGTGRAGRSEGCFVVHPDFITEVIDHLEGGSYLLAWREGV